MDKTPGVVLVVAGLAGCGIRGHNRNPGGAGHGAGGGGAEDAGADPAEGDAAEADAGEDADGDEEDAGAEPEPEPEPIAGPCGGPFLVTTWLFDTAPFDLRYVNSLIHRDLEQQDLLVTLEVGPGPELVWTDGVQAEGGGLVPDPDVAESPPIPVELTEERGIVTTEPGRVTSHLSAADYGGAQALDWTLHLVEVDASYDEECSRLAGRLSGAFRDEPSFSIPGRPVDTDTDGDGEPDAYWMESNVLADALAGIVW